MNTIIILKLKICKNIIKIKKVILIFYFQLLDKKILVGVKKWGNFKKTGKLKKNGKFKKNEKI